MQQDEFTEKIIPLSSKLLRFACFFLGNSDDGRDVVQDVLLKLWENRKQLREVGNAEAYAMRMIRNKCLDRIKSFSVAKKSQVSEVSLVFHETGDPDALEWRDTTRMVMEMAGRLPELQRSILFLRDMEQLEFEEISAITGLNVNAVRVSLSRARKQVRDDMLKIWEYETRRSKNIAAEIL